MATLGNQPGTGTNQTASVLGLCEGLEERYCGNMMASSCGIPKFLERNVAKPSFDLIFWKLLECLQPVRRDHYTIA
jgi:hypothetical protein